MSDGINVPIELLVFGGFGLFTAGALLGRLLGWLNERDNAVKAGKAEYYLDENNVRQWRWKAER
jgi:hypothetical protein